MSFRNSVIVVASPRPRVGKTLLARLLVDYYLLEGHPVRAFDLNSGEGTLAQFLPEHVTVSTITDVHGQIALFDRLVLVDDTVKIVDVGHETFESFFSLAQRIDFADEARRRGIALVVLFMISSDRPAADAYRKLGENFPGMTLTPVQNEMFGAGQMRDKFPPIGRGAALLRVPALAPGLRKHVERPPFSFSGPQLANARNIPLDNHLELQRWLRRIYLEFRELDLRVLLADLQSSIRF
jgi:hypothetical protein